MVYPPQHYREVTQRRTGPRRERWVLALGGLIAAAVAAVALFSLTSASPTSGNGCLNFTYSMVMGGEQFHACGARARKTCADPPHFGKLVGGLANGLLDQLPSECRKAGLPYKTHS